MDSLTKIKFSKLLLKEIKRRGVKRVFGVPGRENASILFNEAEGLDYITSRVEFNAGIAADFTGRLTRKPQVCFSTMGPGAANMTTAVASAMLNHSPLIFISAQLESDDKFFNLTHQCVDQTSILEPISKWSYELESAEDIVWAIDNAFKVATKEPVGPVHISIPTNFFSKKLLISHDIDTPLAQRITPNFENFQEATAKSVYDKLVKSKSPICLIGEGAIRIEAAESIVKFCREWNIPFVTAANAKGLTEFEDPLNYGSASPYMEGILGYPALKHIYEPVDMLICFGYQYGDDLLPKMWNYGETKTIVSVGTNPIRQIHSKFNPDFECLGDISKFISYWSELGSSPKENREIRTLKDIYTEIVYSQNDSLNVLTPIQVINVINQNLGDGVFCTDIGYYRHHAILFSRPNRVGQFFTDAGLSSFGSGLPSAIGAQLEYPEKKVFLLCGDGGFHSGSCDLETLSRYKLPVIIVVMNNNAFELIGKYQGKSNSEPNEDIVLLGYVDFVKLAEANGCKGFKASSVAELDRTIQEHDGVSPLVIEVTMEYRDPENFKESF